MLKILAIVFALVAIYAVKATVMLRGSDNAIDKSVSFSWVRPELQEEGATPAWAIESKSEAPLSLRTLQRVQGARAF